MKETLKRIATGAFVVAALGLLVACPMLESSPRPFIVTLTRERTKPLARRVGRSE
jgi:hypothetical protein